MYPAEQRRQDVVQVGQKLVRAERRIDHAELHADEPRHGTRNPLRHTRQWRHRVLRGQERPLDAAGGPRAGAAHRVELRAANLGDPLRRIPAPGRPPPGDDGDEERVRGGAWQFGPTVGRRLRRPQDHRSRGHRRAAAVSAGRTVHLRDDGLGAHLPRAEDLGRIPARDAPAGRLRLHRGRDGLVRRRSATSAGHRLQAGRRSGPGLFRHRPAVSARRIAAQDREHVPRLLQAARDHRRRVRRRRVLPDRRRRRRGRSRPAGVRRPPQQRAEAGAGRVRHRRQAGGGVRQQPTDPADLRLRQQRPPLPVGRRGADRGSVG